MEARAFVTVVMRLHAIDTSGVSPASIFYAAWLHSADRTARPFPVCLRSRSSNPSHSKYSAFQACASRALHLFANQGKAIRGNSCCRIPTSNSACSLAATQTLACSRCSPTGLLARPRGRRRQRMKLSHSVTEKFHDHKSIEGQMRLHSASPGCYKFVAG